MIDLNTQYSCTKFSVMHVRAIGRLILKTNGSRIEGYGVYNDSDMIVGNIFQHKIN